jgi:hypothetical protein
MRVEDVEMAATEAMPQTGASLCAWLGSVHRFLTDLSKMSGTGFLEKIALRAVAGAITRVKQRNGCA